jgi:hypothetical protein
MVGAMARESAGALDEVLSLQLLIAWAGETPGGDAPRLGWWRTDLIDEQGGHDLLARLLRRTHQWAGLVAVREAARALDLRRRSESGNPDGRLTLFHFGWALDEALNERLALHVREARPPADALPSLATLGKPFERSVLAGLLPPAPPFKTEPAGRQLKLIADESLPARAARLASALLAPPHAPEYPVAFLTGEAT